MLAVTVHIFTFDMDQCEQLSDLKNASQCVSVSAQESLTELNAIALWLVVLFTSAVVQLQWNLVEL